MTIPSIEDLIKQAEYKQHPYGKVWQRFDQEAFAELVGNIDRRGLDKEITRYQGMILEGWHRYLACLATKTKTKFIEFDGTGLEAAELVHASGIRRHSSADQRYASFSLLCDACPAFKQKYEELKQKGEEQKKDGKPLDTDAQRVDVVQAKADAAGVSKTTAKKVERVKKQNPSAVADIAAGKTTANKEVKKLNKKDKKAKAPPKPKESLQEEATLKPGDKFYRVYHNTVSSFPPIVQLLCYKVEAERDKTYLATNGESVPKSEALTLEAAKDQYVAVIMRLLPEMTEALAKLKAALKNPRIEHRDKKKA